MDISNRSQFSTDYDDGLLNNNNIDHSRKINENQIDVEKGESFDADNKTSINSIYNNNNNNIKTNGTIHITSTNELNNSESVNNINDQHNKLQQLQKQETNTSSTFVCNGSNKNFANTNKSPNCVEQTTRSSYNSQIPKQLYTVQLEQQQQHQQKYSTDTNNGNTNTQASITVDGCATVINTTDTETNKKTTSNSAVSILRRSKTIGIVVISGILAVSIVISLCTTMGWDYTVPAIVVGVVAIVATSGLWHWIYIAILTAPRDIRALYRYAKLLTLVKRCQRKNVSVCDVFHQYVAKHPQKTCIIYEGQEWTFLEINEFSNRIANLFQQQGYKKGDVVGLYMENRPEFVATWLGLSKIGVIVPLINTNLRQASLVHSVQIAKCQGLIFGESLSVAIEEVADSLNSSSLTFYQFNDDIKSAVLDKTTKNLTTLLQTAAKTDVATSSKSPDGQSDDLHHRKLLYIYTSGTTGLPKAAVITHSRYIFIAAAIHYMANFKADDIFYTPLPLYHTAGGVMSIGQALLFGSTVVIRKKFSASGYFPDCQKYKCTVAQYIGEMCRYILATPSSSADTEHNVRVIFGNGLRPQIWPQFISRFKIPNVAEFYGATEGNANIVNITNVVGAIGFVSRIIPSVYPISIIKADPNTGEPIRGANGLCQHCKPNEPGVFIGKIMPGDPSRAFLGYVDKAASSKKVVRDVFKKGDSAFISGDILVADVYGNLYFKDRTGDTFRWKGENVSTSEVEAQVSNIAGYRDTVVYGVEIPNTEGRAGMAAILDVNQSVNLDELANGLKAVLPAYARPQFIRLLRKVDMTGTFKLKKLDLQKEGFDPNVIDDSLYYLQSNGKYSKLDKAAYEQISNGQVRF